jgi:hypothetical protein
VAKAVRDILTGKCFDNGTLCSSEQAIVCDAPVRDAVLAELRKQGAHVCSAAEKALLEKVIQTPRRTLNTRIVGKSAEHIAGMAGIPVAPGTRALVAFADGVGPDHPISMEKLSPCLAFYEVTDWRQGCQRCIEILTFGGLGHTLSLHAGDDQVIRAFGLEKPAARICVNTPSALGAVGITTNLFPSMTLGCGAFGGNITSDNISPLHLINLKRVAWGVREAGTPRGTPQAVPSSPVVVANTPGVRSTIESVVDQWLGGRAAVPVEPSSGCHPAGAAVPRPPTPESVMPPPLGSFKDLPAAPVHKPEAHTAKPVPFVCEDDVRAAMRKNEKIGIGKRTIITPSARDLGEGNGVFVAAD